MYMRFLRIFSLFVFLGLSSQMVRADIGRTYELKQERKAILAKMESLTNDSLTKNSDSLMILMQNQIIYLDEKIFSSYNETVERLAEQRSEAGNNGRYMVYLALISVFFALFLSLLIVLARSRVLKTGKTGLFEVYKQLTADFIGSVSADKPASSRTLRVNAVVVIGLIMMSLSILAFLISAL